MAKGREKKHNRDYAGERIALEIIYYRFAVRLGYESNVAEEISNGISTVHGCCCWFFIQESEKRHIDNSTPSTQMQNKTKIDHGSTRHVWGKRGEYIFLYFLFCKKEVISKANNLLSLQKHKTYVLVFTRRGFLAAKKLESVSLQGPGTSSKGLKSFQMN